MPKGKPKRTRGSWAGHSFYEEYQECPWKFYMHRVLRIAPKYTAPPLLFGTAFHEAKAVFYKTKSRQKAINKFLSTLKYYAHLYEDSEVYHNHLWRGELMVDAWVSDYGIEDLKKFDLVASEKTLEVELELLPGFFHTVKPDTIVQTKGRNKTGYILESKSTMFSANITAQAVTYGDQATGQIWAVRKKYPELKLRGVIPDVTFWAKTTTNPAKIKNLRGSVITRTNRDLYEYELMMTSLIHEISQRVEALDEFTPIELFPRSTTWCMSFSHPCEYVDICRNYDLTAKGKAPRGFFRDQAPKKQNALKKIKDTI